MGNLKISFDERVINSGVKIAGLSIIDAHKMIGDAIRDIVIMSIVNAKDIGAWKKD